MDKKAGIATSKKITLQYRLAKKSLMYLLMRKNGIEPLEVTTFRSTMEAVKGKAGWSIDRTNLLKDLWENTDFPASEIAKKIDSELTRNAVIGKANRMKLLRKSKTSLRPVASKRKSQDYIGKILAFEEEKRKFFASCGWPQGDPKLDDFSFCGEEVKKSKPYCKEHMVRAYSKQKSK